MALPTPDQPVLIIGAGIVGLTLAQALKKDNIPFQIFERDPRPDSRSPGWGLSIHWALKALESCLPPHLFSRLSTAQVDPMVGRNDTGRFLFLDLATAIPKYVIPPAFRLRLNRRMFREVLLDDLDVKWGKEIDSFVETNDGVEVSFRDGMKAQGSLLVGADGSNSKTRQILCPGSWQLYQLPVRLIGATVKLTRAEIEPLRAVDPLLFMGCHPETRTFMWFSVLSIPDVNGSSGAEEFFEGQVLMSWEAKSADDEVPTSNEERLEKMKQMAKPFEHRLRTVVQSISEATEITEIKIQDWPHVEWSSSNGRATLIGDAAHAMTMYRGEAANHGITDAWQLHDTLLSVSRGETPLDIAMSEFETQLRVRTRDAVLLSRQACLDAHDLHGLKDDSPLVSKRAIVRTPAMAVTT